MDSYTILAKYYDRLMGDFDYNGYVAFVKNYLSGEGIDLCCGSGKITMALCQLGNRMTGVDLSQDMLNIARENAKKQGKNILWINESVCDFQPNHSVDFVTCVCDGFNYINNKDLKKSLDMIKSYVKNDGYLIFDVSTEYKLKNILGNNLFCEDYDDLTYIWNNRLNNRKNCVDMDISFFECQNDKNYLRIDEEHTQYIHTIEDIMSILSNDWIIQSFDGEKFSKLKNTSKRALFVCKKK